MSSQASLQHQNPRFSSSSSIEELEKDAPQLLKLQEHSPSLKIFTISSENYKSLNTHFQANNPTQPLAIIRPQNASEVSEIVKFAKEAKLPLSVLSGGHDSFRRSSAGKLVLDMKEMDSFALSEDKKSIVVGGGVIFDNLVQFLDPYGLGVTIGGCPSVGVVGWATIGGYGFFNGKFGMGVDQILGATLVTADGEIIDAAEETLWGLRGGGTWGVVADMRIKVYEMPKILAGMMVFQMDEAREVLLGYQRLCDEDFPDELGSDIALANFPGAGKVLVFLFTWCSTDFETGNRYLEKFRKLGNVVMDTVAECMWSPRAFRSSSAILTAMQQHSQRLQRQIRLWEATTVTST
jgi:FAD/FMN-containing dehydrogenase